MMLRLYSLAMVGAQPLLRRKLRRRGRVEPGYLQHVDERFGRYEGHVEPGALWIHAVSLGETRAAAIVIGKLRELHPGIRILLTHGTATGRAEGERLVRPGCRGTRPRPCVLSSTTSGRAPAC
jgi:3-deoxy-D-manno-octulosonic-acid transferase